MNKEYEVVTFLTRQADTARHNAKDYREKAETYNGRAADALASAVELEALAEQCDKAVRLYEAAK